MFKMLIGMSFLTVITDIVLTDSNYRKYVKSVLGIFTVMILVQGMAGIDDLKIDTSIIDEIENKAYENTYILEEDIKNEMIKNIKSNIRLKLLENGISLKEIEINIDENLNIINLVIRLYDTELNDKAKEIINKEFYIDKNVIELGD